MSNLQKNLPFTKQQWQFLISQRIITKLFIASASFNNFWNTFLLPPAVSRCCAQHSAILTKHLSPWRLRVWVYWEVSSVLPRRRCQTCRQTRARAPPAGTGTLLRCPRRGGCRCCPRCSPYTLATAAGNRTDTRTFNALLLLSYFDGELKYELITLSHH